MDCTGQGYNSKLKKKNSDLALIHLPLSGVPLITGYFHSTHSSLLSSLLSCGRAWVALSLFLSYIHDRASVLNTLAHLLLNLAAFRRPLSISRHLVPFWPTNFNIWSSRIAVTCLLLKPFVWTRTRLEASTYSVCSSSHRLIAYHNSLSPSPSHIFHLHVQIHQLITLRGRNIPLTPAT